VSADKTISIDQYPRAKQSISRAKGLGGIGCFVVVGFISLRAGVPFFDSGLRALVAGVVGYAVAWFGAVQVWRQLAIAQVRRHQAREAERRLRLREGLQESIDSARAERERQTA
jgi:hypothetical protein